MAQFPCFCFLARPQLYWTDRNWTIALLGLGKIFRRPCVQDSADCRCATERFPGYAETQR